MTDAWKDTVKDAYPQAKPFPDVNQLTKNALGADFTAANTILTFAACRDEINSGAIEVFTRQWGEAFDFAGLGGFPSGGLTAFGAYSHHVPDGGNLFILYGPHIGVNPEGELGKFRRVEMANDTTSCGAVVGCVGMLNNTPDFTPAVRPMDEEQCLVEAALYARKDAFLGQDNEIKLATDAMYEAIDERIQAIVEKSGYTGKVVLLGGIMINTPVGEQDHFDARRFEVRDYNNGTPTIENKVDQLH